MTRKNIARSIVVGLLLSCAALPAFVALAGRPAPRVALPTEPAAAAPTPRVITLDAVTITASVRRVDRAPRPAVLRRSPRSAPRLVTLDQGGRPGHRTVVAWGM